MSVLLALALSLGVLPVRAWAVWPAAEVTAVTSGGDALDSDALFASYAEHTVYTIRQEAMRIRYGETALSGANLQIYNRLRTEITKVAAGSLDSSVFKIDTSDLGVTASGGSLRGVDTSLIFDALLADLPYDLYWYDKTGGTEISYGSGYSGVVLSITFKMTVAQDYARFTADGKKYYSYAPDPAKTGAAAAAVENAQALVDRCAGMSDYDKLAAYRDYICGQVSYNDTAASSSRYPYGDPWQMIYVFDNNPSTDVVCEGYAKAFKYLCDISTFANKISCYTVSGYTSGAHMWNIVRINNQSYLVDITNGDTDDGSSARLDALFLAGASGSVASGYTIHIPQYSLGGGRNVMAQDIRYTYGDSSKRLYGADVLTLAGSDYVPSADPDPSAPVPSESVPSEEPVGEFADVPPGAFYYDAVDWAVANEITTGTTPTKFSPGRTCTHGEILTFLWRAEGEPESSAQPPIPMTGDEFYNKAARWAAERGIIGADFTPDALCTRLYAVYYIWQAFDRPESSGENPFSDVPMDLSAAEAVEAVLWALEAGVTTGATETTFNPGKICSRGEIITFLYRAYT